jgi:hypothetical protein
VLLLLSVMVFVEPGPVVLILLSALAIPAIKPMLSTVAAIIPIAFFTLYLLIYKLYYLFVYHFNKNDNK